MEAFDDDLERYYNDLDKTNDCPICGEPCENEYCEYHTDIF